MTNPSNSKTKCVMSLSGGLDSTTLLHYAVKSLDYEVTVALFFDYGQRHIREFTCAQQQASAMAKEFRMIRLPELESIASDMSALVNPSLKLPTIEEAMGDPQPLSYVPNRNMIFLAYSVAVAESVHASVVLYGAQKHDTYGYWDTTPQFVDRLSQVYRLNRKYPISLEAPFINHSKYDELLLGLSLGVDYSKTWSCYRGLDVCCGRCATCAERLHAFQLVGVPDPLPYAYLPDAYRKAFPNIATQAGDLSEETTTWLQPSLL